MFSVSIGLTTATGLVIDTIIAFSRVEHVRFTRPVFFGDTIHVVKTVIATDEEGAGHGLVTFHTRVVNQDGAVVMVYVDKLLIRRRPAGFSVSQTATS